MIGVVSVSERGKACPRVLSVVSMVGAVRVVGVVCGKYGKHSKVLDKIIFHGTPLRRSHLQVRKIHLELSDPITHRLPHLPKLATLAKWYTSPQRQLHAKFGKSSEAVA